MRPYSMRRRQVMKAATMGLAGVGAPQAIAGTAVAETDHDHSGDQLGVEEPVESISANTVTIHDFDLPSTYLVFEHERMWSALETERQNVEFQSDDGVAVINDALNAVGRFGQVRVVSDEGGVTLESNTTLEFPQFDTSLVLERGVTFEYAGDGEAVRASGNNSWMQFDVIDANGADHCIRDVGLGPGATIGNTLRGASESLFFLDSDDRITAAGQYFNIRELDCTAHPTPVGFYASTATEHEVEGARAEGYWLDIGVIRGPTEVGIRLGDEGVDESTVGFFLCNVYVDGETNDAEQLVELNDKQHSVRFHGYTPATGGEWDLVIEEMQIDGTVHAATRRNDLRVKREVLQHVDTSKFDRFGGEVIDFTQRPEALDGYETVTAGSGKVSLRGPHGHVEHTTGLEPLSWANVRKRVDRPASALSFDHPGVLQTSVMMPDTVDQKAWLLWGNRNGPGIGWLIADEAINGFVHDGELATVRPLVSLDGTTDAWSLTAFYAPPTEVHYYVEDLLTEEVSTSLGDTETTVTVDSAIASPYLPGSETRERRLAGSISTNLPSGTTGAGRIMTIDVQNLVAGNKRLRWTDWKHHHYPNASKRGEGA